MMHEIHRVVSFEKVGLFTLRIEFEDSTQSDFDFRPVLKGELYASLRDPAIFDQVKLDSEVHTLVWPNGADFDPAMLYNWEEAGSALEALAETWTVPTT